MGNWLSSRSGRGFPRAFALVGFLVVGMAAPAAAQEIHRETRWVVLRAADYDANTRVELRPQLRAPSGGPTATFNVTYNGFPAQAMTAFQHAVDIWAGLIVSDVTINVQANWMALDPGILGSARAEHSAINFFGAPLANSFYPAALADALAGVNLAPGSSDIIANFSSTLPNWYLGTDGNTPAGQFDLVTVVLHEIGHGLGFFGSMRVDDGMGTVECTGVAGRGCWGIGNPLAPRIFDQFTEDNVGNALLNGVIYPNNSVALGNALVSGNVFFDAPGARGANGGLRPELYAPNPFDPGSSYSHLDEAVFPAANPNSLMTPMLALAESIHDPGPITLCMFEDMGWRTLEDCAGAGGFAPPLFNQAVGCAPSAVISQLFPDGGNVGIDAADDFVVPMGESWDIDTIAVRGVFSMNGAPVDSVNVFFYNDSGGLPGTAVCSYPAQTPIGGNDNPNFTLQLGELCELGSGTYWAQVQAVLPLDPPNDRLWFWVQNNASAGAPWAFQDVADLLGTGCTTWAPHGACAVGSATDLCFGIDGVIGDDTIMADGFE